MTSHLLPSIRAVAGGRRCKVVLTTLTALTLLRFLVNAGKEASSILTLDSCERSAYARVHETSQHENASWHPRLVDLAYLLYTFELISAAVFKAEGRRREPWPETISETSGLICAGSRSSR